MANYGGWTVYTYGHQTHVVPLGDLKEHDLFHCSCAPRVDEDDNNIVVHNSFDGREQFEQEERKSS